MAGEVALARRLANAGAPVVSANPGPAAGAAREGGLRRDASGTSSVHRRADETRDALAAAEALKAVHAALAALEDALPPFTDGLAACANRLADRAAMAALGQPDRGFLEDRLEALRGRNSGRRTLVGGRCTATPILAMC